MKNIEIYKRIQIINNKNNIGLTKSLNKLINKSKGDFIARQDADDSSDHRIKEQINIALKKSKSKIAVSKNL